MSKIELPDTNLENRPTLRLLQGGKDDGGTSGGGISDSKNWLSMLPRGVVFLCRPYNSSEPDCKLFQIIRTTGKSVCLFSDMDGERKMGYVDSALFSQKYRWQELVYQVPEEIMEQLDKNEEDVPK